MRKIRAEGYHTLNRKTIFDLFYEGIVALISNGEFLKIFIISFKLTFTLI